MTTHELAAELLKQPNVPVVINGYGSDEGTLYEVDEINEPEENSFESFYHPVEKDNMGYPIYRTCVTLGYKDE